MKKETTNKEAPMRDRVKNIMRILERHDIIRGLNPEKLRHILEDLGPTFVKLGQIMSMRPDMIPQEYCDELTLLRTDVKHMPFDEVLEVLESEWDESWESVFESIDEKPLGSASIAQVHKATLKDGTSVVIKVQRPGIFEKMAQDVKLLHKAAGILKIISRTGRVIDLHNVVDEMWTVARQELDFLIEANHIKEFTEINADIKYIAFPKVEWALTTPRVLVMEHIEGIGLDDTDMLEEKGYDIREIGEKIAENFAKQVLDDGFFHADPHPGNVRIRDGKIVWIDLGMTGRLSGRDRELIRSAVLAIVEKDIDVLKEVVLSIGIIRQKIDHSKLHSDIEAMVSKYGVLELGSIDIGQTMMDFMNVAESNGIGLPSGVSMLGRGILTIEGVLSKIDPDINFVQIVTQHMTGALWRDFDFVRELQRGGRAMYSFGKKAIDIPGQISGILKTAAKGQTKLNVEIVGPQALRFGRIADRIIICLLAASIIIGSSLICTADISPKVLGIPWISAAGFALAAIMSGWLMILIMKNRRP